MVYFVMLYIVPIIAGGLLLCIGSGGLDLGLGMAVSFGIVTGIWLIIFDIMFFAQLQNFVKRKVRDKFHIISTLVDIINNNQKYQEKLSLIKNDILTLDINESIQKLNLPTLNEIKGTHFFYYYQDFYDSKKTISILKLIETEWGSKTPLCHPMASTIYKVFDTMSKNEEKILTEYPWLLQL